MSFAGPDIDRRAESRSSARTEGTAPCPLDPAGRQPPTVGGTMVGTGEQARVNPPSWSAPFGSGARVVPIGCTPIP
jgi:hypothetical protein